MRKFLLAFMCVLFCFCCGCETQTALQLAHISDNTLGNSTNYSVKVVLDDDERMDEKYVDLQIKSSESGQVVSIGEHGEEKTSVRFDKKDYWYNLTYLVDKANGVSAEGGYQKYQQHGSKTYNLTTKSDVKLTFRVVVGNLKKNTQTNEEILVLSEPISNEFVLKMRKSS